MTRPSTFDLSTQDIGTPAVSNREHCDAESSRHPFGTSHRRPQDEHFQNAAGWGTHGRGISPNSIERCSLYVTGGRNTDSPVPEGTPQTPRISSDGTPRYDTTQRGYDQVRSSEPTNVIQVTACCEILRTISFPFDQLTVLDTLLPNLPNDLSWNDSNHIIRSIKVDWCRLRAFRALMSRLPTILTVSEKDQVLRNFTSSYYRNKIISLLDDSFDNLPEGASRRLL